MKQRKYDSITYVFSLNWKKYKDKATTITVGNYKGGAGKTTNTILMAYSLAKLGIKVLVIDLDPQSNATKELILTMMLDNPEKELTAIEETVMKGIENKDLTNLPINIIENLDLIPSYIDFQGFPKHLYRNTSTQEEEDYFLSNLLEPLKKNYDIILIDVPPMSIEVTRNAVVGSDYVLISLQTQEGSLTGAETYVEELSKLHDQYSLDLDIVGILPVLFKNDGRVDEYIQIEATKKFGEENIFKHVIPNMERIKRFAVNGISNIDRHDKNVLKKYTDVTIELLERLETFNS